ncbi:MULTISPECIES: acireductone dioxygenase [Dickeya]|uniref:Acireductone dioxygenase n=1 Tax=Dickeya fangzhongdai TaxID=1778540 RepID=A0A2K8QIQ1_9GAMM|nr:MULTISPECIES: cupin domain-containing protein [Dickeya]ATZ92965.1 cupin [Dickeya fangzhongdai]AYH46689.1 cupin [Dickeya fangzhongdai]MBO8135803.1 cupin domain-containing protein [Dickeya fangzhongdai]QOH46396.1 cupin domain-containing protein [Dickeya fangzhongdai]QOH50703.1 cupin domain-containing protein [Dickeya fangzhongdai]
MTTLAIFHRPHLEYPTQQFDEFDQIAALLAAAGLQLERWHTGDTPADVDGDALLARFRQDIDRLSQREGYTSADVISLTPEHPDRAALREKFLQEHTHSEDEVRFFVRGSGTFFVPAGEQVYRLTCQAGDLLRVPANTPHWFDSGEFPDFTAIRIFTNPSGWVGHFTGRPTFH